MSKKVQTASIKRLKDGSVVFKSTGGFDLRKLFPADFAEPEKSETQSDETAQAK